MWNPPLDLLPLVVRKIEAEGGRGVLLDPNGPGQVWYARLRVLEPCVQFVRKLPAQAYRWRRGQRTNGRHRRPLGVYRRYDRDTESKVAIVVNFETPQVMDLR